MANAITCIRIICSIGLLFCQALTTPFYALYLIAGFTDMIDGTVARKTGSAGEFGSRLDTLADFVLVAVCLVKLVPVLDIEVWLIIWILLIAVIKFINIAIGFRAQKQLVSVHSVLNRITGILLFVLPLTIELTVFQYCAIIVCIVATIAAVHEGYMIRTA